MEGQQFDAWTKTLAAGQSRRAILRRLGGGLAGVLAVARWSPAAAAPPDHVGRPQGRCPDGFTNCRGMCVILDADLNNCGACAVVCPAGWDCCDGACIDAANDPANCGACGIACGVVETCSGGACQPCGLEGEPCCPPDDTCLVFNFCDASGFCQGCGTVGKPCCPDPNPVNACGETFSFCNANGFCQPCGFEGDSCCPPDNTCALSHSCDASGFCRQCGLIGTPCCNVTCFEGSCTDGTCQ